MISNSSHPDTNPRPAVRVHGLSHSYTVGNEAVVALQYLDLAVAEGEFVAVVGPSGCGKTTLLRAIAGLLEPTTGNVEVLGGSSASAKSEHAIGLVTQDPGLLPWLDVTANVRLTLELANESGMGPGKTEHVRGLLERVDIAGFADYYPGQLSGGMRQRVALARALAHRPRLLLMDEPFGALDELSREEMRLELLRVWEQERTSVVFVTHSIREAVHLADRVIVMNGSPGTVTAEIPVDLARPRPAEMEDRPGFQELVTRIRGLLFRSDPGEVETVGVNAHGAGH